jgi:hypothetical protein
MALVINDRVKETSTTIGTATFELAGASEDFESFVAGVGTTNSTYYCIANGSPAAPRSRYGDEFQIDETQCKQ